MIQKLFDWTGRDIAYWEKIQKKGLGNFILWYGIAITGSLLFIVLGLMALLGCLRRMAGSAGTSNDWMFLMVQLVFIALVSIVAGVANSLITWVVEQRLYRKYKA
jgi:hypothetical protein